MRLGGVRVRLSVALLIVVALALGIVYLVVVPQLRHRLISAKLAQLERAAPSVARQIPQNRFTWDVYAQNASQSANARVVIYDVFGPPLTLGVEGDSNIDSSDVEQDPLAYQAAASNSEARGTVTRDGEPRAEVALPSPVGTRVVLLSASLHDSLANVNLVSRRLLLAGAIALAAALLIGFGGASLFARRIRKLERAADRIASGKFDEPVVDHHKDELGDLAKTFDRMRGRLLQLEHARREFIANASHELRTPLFSLAGSLELLVDEEMDDATRREFLTMMRQQVHRLTKLATELLDLSRLDAGRLHVNLQPLDLPAMAETVVSEFGAVAAEHTLEVESDGDPRGVGDEQRVLQIGRILVENALRHTPPGTRVVVRAERRPDGAALVVEDDGPGIPREHAGHVFERFYRIEGGLASGSGLGLAIGRELAQVMGGRLELDSRPGKTVFTLWLAAPAGIEAEPKPREREPTPV